MEWKSYPNIAEYLKDKQIRQRVLARQLGISEAFLSEIKHGRRTPRLELALRICEHCRIPIESLLGRAA